MWHANDTIAIIQLIFYIPTTLLSIFLCIRHRSSGWIYTLILCLVRIIGSICQFVSHNDQSAGLLRTILVLDSVGLSPLLLATLGLLRRFIKSLNANSAPTFTILHFFLLHSVVITGLVLAIVGGTSMTTSVDGSVQIPTTSKIGVILYIVGFVCISLVLFFSAPRSSVVPSRERRVPLAIILALPFILVRLVYSALSVFSHDHLFNIATGSVPARVAMSVIEEFVVVGIYVLLGFFVDKLDDSTIRPVTSRPWRSNENDGSVPLY